MKKVNVSNVSNVVWNGRDALSVTLSWDNVKWKAVLVKVEDKVYIDATHFRVRDQELQHLSRRNYKRIGNELWFDVNSLDSLLDTDFSETRCCDWLESHLSEIQNFSWKTETKPNNEHLETRLVCPKVEVRDESRDLVSVKDGQIIADSLGVAERFGKRHDNILRNIANLECSDEFRHSNFGLDDFVDLQGKKRPMYTMTRDGFSFLVMSFTGRKAAVWKEKYIAAFNALEQQLLSRSYYNAESLKRLNNIYTLDKDLFASETGFCQLYVVVFDTGVVKVGKGKSAEARIRVHKHNAAVHEVTISSVYVCENPTVTEQQLLAFCNQHGTLVRGNEYFVDLDAKKVVSWLKANTLIRQSR